MCRSPRVELPRLPRLYYEAVGWVIHITTGGPRTMNMRREHDVIVVGEPLPAQRPLHTWRSLDTRRWSLRGQFPQHRIGESLLPSMMPILDDFDLIRVESEGFEEDGRHLRVGQVTRAWDVLFGENPCRTPTPTTWSARGSTRSCLRTLQIKGLRSLNVSVKGPLMEETASLRCGTLINRAKPKKFVRASSSMPAARRLSSDSRSLIGNTTPG